MMGVRIRGLVEAVKGVMRAHIHLDVTGGGPILTPTHLNPAMDLMDSRLNSPVLGLV